MSCWRTAVSTVVIIVASTLVTQSAGAQNTSARLSPGSPEVLESAREVVSTVSLWRAGRVAYRTFDGSCRVEFTRGGLPPHATCSENQKARAPEDYIATSGELVFAAGGSEPIAIPIVDDGAVEGGEVFTLVVWEEANADPWIDRGDSVIARIKDDEVDTNRQSAAAPAARSFTSTTPAGGQSSGSAVGAGTAATVDPAKATNARPPAGELRAGPDAGLTSEGARERTSNRRGGGGGSISGPAIGLGIAALGVGTLAVMRRRRRSSARRA